jgi:hypothetical protein
VGVGAGEGHSYGGGLARGAVGLYPRWLGLPARFRRWVSLWLFYDHSPQCILGQPEGGSGAPHLEAGAIGELAYVLYEDHGAIARWLSGLGTGGRRKGLRVLVVQEGRLRKNKRCCRQNQADHVRA